MGDPGVQSFRLLVIMRDAANERHSGTILLKSIHPGRGGLRAGWPRGDPVSRHVLPRVTLQRVFVIDWMPQPKGSETRKECDSEDGKVKELEMTSVSGTQTTSPEAENNPIGWNCEMFLVGEMNSHEAS